MIRTNARKHVNNRWNIILKEIRTMAMIHTLHAVEQPTFLNVVIAIQINIHGHTSQL